MMTMVWQAGGRMSRTLTLHLGQLLAGCVFVKKTTVELVVIFLRMRQRSTKIFAHLDSITLTNFDADFVLGVVAGRMRICHKRKELLKWIFSLLRSCQKLLTVASNGCKRKASKLVQASNVKENENRSISKSDAENLTVPKCLFTQF